MNKRNFTMLGGTVTGLMVATGLLAATATTAAAAAGEGISPAQQTQVDEIFAQWDRTDSPGCQAFAFRDGDIILSKGYGMADLEWGQPIDADTVFYLASTSKQFAAASIALLIQDGAISLDTDVRDFIPELPEFGKPILVRHLVFHTSGLRDYLGLLSLQGPQIEGVSNQTTLDLMSRQQDLNYETGDHWAYTNSGYVLMAVLVERVSGKSLAEFAQERLFAPLGMAHSHFDDNYQKVVPHRARSYVPGPDGEWLRQPKTINAVGDGNLLSTVADLQRWDENFYQPKVGGQAFLDLMQKAGAEIPGANASYAFGLFVDTTYRGLPVVHHAGGFAGFSIQLTRFPQQHFSAGALCNAGNANASELTFRIADVLLAGDLAPVEPPPEAAAETSAAATPPPAYTLSAKAAKELVGIYRSPEIGVEGVVRQEGQALHFSGVGKLDGPFIPVAEDQFHVMLTYAPGMSFPVSFKAERDKRGKVSRLMLDMGRVNNFRLEKQN